MFQRMIVVKIFSLSVLILAVCSCGGGGGGGGGSNNGGGSSINNGGGNSSATSSTPTQITISGSVTGLTTSGLILQNNGSDDISVNANGNFSFPQKVLPGNTYSVTIKAQPTDSIPSVINDQIFTCDIANATGTAGQTNISNIAVSCSVKMVYRGSGLTGGEPWVTNGTANDARLLKDIENDLNSSNPAILIKNKGWIYFITFNDLQGVALWKTNGTPEATTLVKTLTSSGTIANYIPQNAIVFNDEIYFAAYDEAHGLELWKSDGTTDGTTIVKDIKVGTGNSGPWSFVLFNGGLYFFASNDSTIGLWKTDGTTAGTTLVHDTQLTIGWQELIAFSGAIYFAASDSTHGTELWKSDGTTAGTTLVKDITPGTASSVSRLYFIANSTSLFFTVNDSILWKTDGTSAGTLKLKDIAVSTGIYGTPVSLTAFKDSIYFPAQDNNVENCCLWKSNGSPQGTALVENQAGHVNNLTALNDVLYFSAVTSGTLNTQLWKTDGTAANTSLVKDLGLNTAIGNSIESGNLYPFKNKLYFTLASSPWVTDGTTAGTFKLKDISVTTSSTHKPFFTIGDKLFFTAQDIGTSGGSALWTTNGTTAGTTLIQSFFEF